MFYSNKGVKDKLMQMTWLPKIVFEDKLAKSNPKFDDSPRETSLGDVDIGYVIFPYEIKLPDAQDEKL